MDIEVSEVVDFLAQHSPFRELPLDARRALAQQLTMGYFRRGTTIIELGARNDTLYLIRSGAVDLVEEHGVLIDRNAAGETFGSLSLMGESPSPYRARAIEDTLVLRLGREQFLHLYETHDAVRDYFAPRQRGRLRRASETLQASADPILRLSARDLFTRSPVTASPTTSIRDAAQLMTAERVSALLLTTDDGRLSGIVTDRDLRSRVVAQGVEVSSPVGEVMTTDPVVVAADTRAFELLMVMTSRGVHHLPVVAEGKPVGLVSAGDLMRLETANPVFLVGDIARQSGVEGVADVVGRSPKLAAQLLARGASAEDVSQVLTAVQDAATSRLIQLAAHELGPAPGPWCWVALGSQARRESSLGSDQDHAIVVADGTDPAWCRALAERVVAGLEACGYPRCPGEAMATKWCLTLADWVAQFGRWLSAPESGAILHTQIFFDMRPVYGDAQLAEGLRSTVVQRARSATRYLGHLAAMAVRREPPLGFFRGFVVERSGEHSGALDIKSGGLHGIIELVRTLALSQGLHQVGTAARIEALRGAGQFTDDAAADLVDAFNFLNELRIRHHVEDGARDNYVSPEHLTPAARRHLRDAFGVIQSAQRTLSYQFQTHRMN